MPAYSSSPAHLDAKDGVALQAYDIQIIYRPRSARAVDIPLLIYNAPGLPKPYRTTPSMVRRLCKLGGFLGMKLSSDQHEDGSTALEMATKGSSFAMIRGGCGNHLLPRSSRRSAWRVIGQGAGINPEILHGHVQEFHGR